MVDTTANIDDLSEILIRLSEPWNQTILQTASLLHDAWWLPGVRDSEIASDETIEEFVQNLILRTTGGGYQDQAYERMSRSQRKAYKLLHAELALRHRAPEDLLTQMALTLAKQHQQHAVSETELAGHWQQQLTLIASELSTIEPTQTYADQPLWGNPQLLAAHLVDSTQISQTAVDVFVQYIETAANTMLAAWTPAIPSVTSG